MWRYVPGIHKIPSFPIIEADCYEGDNKFE